MNGWAALEIGINIYQGFLLIYFINRVTHAAKHPLWIDCTSVAVISLFLSSYLFFEIPFIDTVVFIIPFLHSLIVSRDRWYAKLFWSAVLAVVTIETITIVSNLLMNTAGVSWDTLLGENQYRILYLLSSNLSLFLVLFLTAKLFSGKRTVTVSSFLVFLVLNALQLFSIELIFKVSTENGIVNLNLTAVSICIFLASVVSLVLYELMAHTTLRRQEAEAKLQLLQQSQNHQTELRNMYSAMLQSQHDLRHRYRILEELIKQNSLNSEKTRSLLQEGKPDSVTEDLFFTGSTSVDALLTAKKATMDAEKIRFEYVPYPLSVLPIAEMDFCILLSNLLDNAVEAVRRMPQSADSRAVCLKFARSQDNFIVICQNDYLPSGIRKEQHKYLSSKPDRFLHGYGLESIKNTCEAADGSCTVMHDDRKFTVRIILPVQEGSIQNNA